MARKRGRRTVGRTGCLFWLFILLVIVVILVYRGKGNLRQTFSGLFQGGETPRQVMRDDEEAPAEDPAPSSSSGQAGSSQTGSSQAGSSAVPAQEDTPDTGSSADTESSAGRVADEPGPEHSQSSEAPEPQISESRPSSDSGQAASPSGTEKPPPQEPAGQLAQGSKQDAERRLEEFSAVIYFVQVEGGNARPHPVPTTVQYIDSPLTRTIETLLKGPSLSQKNRGIRSFIPEGTELLSASLFEGHLTLNFNSRFENNYSGRQAILFQLSQVMLTAFEFKTVSTISILIEGRSKQYITGEGIPLQPRYTKEDLSRITSLD
jgi:spore germination protein GerM